MDPQTSKPSIAIYCNSLQAGGDPFTSDYYWQAYQDLMLALSERGVDSYIVSDMSTYMGNGTFSEAYAIDTKRGLDDLIKHENITVDMVFDRGNFLGRDVLTINDPYVFEIGASKIKMFENFAEFQPFSIVCNDFESVKQAFEKIEGKNIVVKEEEGYGGKAVYIGEKSDVITRLPTNYPLLVQEFLDTSMGVPGFATGVHDIRLSLCGGELVGCYIRQAEDGKLHSNVSQGGTMIFMDINDAPKEAVDAAYKIDELFTAYPRYYSADFVNTAKGWKLLEINPQLALLPVTDGVEPQKTLTKLADYLAKTVQTL